MIFKKILSLFESASERPTDLKTHLKLTKSLKIHGVLFEIRKIKIMDYLEGARVMQESFSVYKTKEQKTLDKNMQASLNKAKGFMKDIIMAGVVSPELSRTKEDGDKIYVEEIFNDWLLAQELVKEIMEFTQGKKK